MPRPMVVLTDINVGYTTKENTKYEEIHENKNTNAMHKTNKYEQW